MYNHQTDARGQLDQALSIERALREARRQRQPSFWQSRWQSWAPTNRRRLGWLMAGVLLTLGLLGVSWRSGITHAAIPFIAPAPTGHPVTAAWEKARAAGSYHFTSDVTQVTLPVATINNVGRSSRTEQFYLEGQNDPHSNQLEMTLWSNGGNILDNASGLSIKVADGKSWLRVGNGEWQERESAADSFAPGGDFMAYLQAVTDVRAQTPEERNGIRFTRYTFQIDGPRFAVYMRDTLAEALRARGELPPGTELDVAAYYRDMTGEGELWVDENGLPLRQILTLRFPEKQAQQVHLQMTTDFTQFGTVGMPVADSKWQVAGGMAAHWAQQALPALLPLLGALGLIFVVIYNGRSRKLYNGLATAVILSLIIGPVLTTYTNVHFFDTQRAKAAAQEEQQAASQGQQDLRSALRRTEFNPHLSPIETRDQSLETGVSDQEASLQAPVSNLQAAPAAQLTDPGTDTDGDTLTDFTEERIDTNLADPDSDGDSLNDNIEVAGFSFGGQQWYLDANAGDSNSDGQSDGLEWGLNADGSLRTTVQDTDSDGLPDLFDPDNDNDSVPDNVDVSPFSKTTATFSNNAPLQLAINNLTANQPTLVEFQLRPQDAKQLWFAFNVLDWPQDSEGQVQDLDNQNYADLAASVGRTPAAGEENGDMRAIPMLEIRMPTASANLPPQSDLTPFNISVNDFTADGSTKVAYVPLSIVTDDRSGERVAFSGQMRYLPTGAWANAHSVRLAWVVQALVDLPCDKDLDFSIDCQEDGIRNNAPTIIQNYYTDWSLTGLMVREEHGADTAIVYEDPTGDDNLADDPAIWGLAHVLDGHFVNPRDANNDDVRDLKLSDFPTRFDRDNNPTDAQRFGIPNLLQVETHSYSTVEQAVASTTMTDTAQILNNHFATSVDSNRTVKPLLLFAQELRQRALGLDLSNGSGNYVTQNGAALTLDLAPSGQPAQEVGVSASIKWQAYCAPATGTVSFSPCSDDDYWNVLEARYANLASLPTDGDATWVTSRLALAQVYYVSLHAGYLASVQEGNQILSGRYSLEDEAVTATAVRSLFLGLSTVPLLAVQNMTRLFPAYSGVNSANNFVYQYGQGLRDKLAAFRAEVNNPDGDDLEIDNAKDQIIKGKKLLFRFNFAKVGAAASVLLVIGQIATLWPGLPDEARAGIGSVTILLSFGLTVVLPVLNITAVKFAAPGSTVAVALNVKAPLYTTLFKRATVIGAVVSVALIWGFFIYSAATSGLAPGSPALIRAAVEAIAATIVTILLIVLSINPIGAIIAAVLALVDLILTLICETGHDELRNVPGLGGACFTLTTAITKVISALIYNYELMVDMSKDDLMVTGAPNLTLTDPSKGFVAGNVFTLTLPVTTTIHHKLPGTEEGGGPLIFTYPYLFSADNLKSSTFRYKLFNPASETGDTAVALNDMTSDWQNVAVETTVGSFSLYKGQAATPSAPRANNTLTAGINVKLPLKLGMSYAVPAYECWTLAIIPVCYAKEYEGSTTDIPLDSIRYDIFPASLAEFLTLGSKPDGGQGLGWDPRFGSLPDADGDGLRGLLFNGLDPNDQSWDADGDGLSDAAELQIRQAGVNISLIVRDTDNDGLTDPQEIALGSNPALADTDNDGLADGVEVRHQVVDATTGKPTATWAGGWQVTINSTPARTIWVSSSPFNADSDQDGVSDPAERGLATQVDNQNRPYHPNVYNTSPLAVVTDSSDLDGYLAPGQGFSYTSTVIANVPVAPGVLNVTAPAALGIGGPLGANAATLPFDSLTFSNSQTVTVASNFTVDVNATGQSVILTSTASTRLPNSGASWTWGTLTNDQLPPVTAPYVLRDSAVTASRPDRADNYLFSGQSVNNGITNPDVPGYLPGDVLAYSVPGGVTRQLDVDTDDLQSPFGAFTPPEPNGAFLRGKTNSSVACNNAGQCMVVWEHLTYCHTATINGVNVVATGDESAVEPLIFLARDPNDNNPLDGGFEMIWTPSTNLGVGFHTGGNVNPLPYTFAFCGKTNLYVSEYDTGDLTYIGPDPTGRDWSGMNFLGWHTLNPLEWNTSKLLDYGGFGGYEFKLSVNQGVPASGQQRVIAAAMLSPDGTISKPQFQVSPVRSFTSLNEAGSDAHFNPVVTSDGTNFLVAWENLARGFSNFNSGINTRLLDGAGNPLTNDQPDLDGVALDTSGATGGLGAITQSYADLAAVWANDHYIVTRQMIQRTGVTFSNPNAITSRQIASNGAYVAGSTTTLVTDATARAGDTHGLAWDPAHQNALLVYSAPLNQVGALVFGTDNVGPTQFEGGVQPQAAYHPASQSWLISYPNRNREIEFRQFTTNLGASFVSGTPPIFISDLSTNNLACPVAASAPIVDLRFEELPGATTFVDSSGYGNDAVCDRGCPAAGLPGAPNAPLSDYAVKFNRADPRLTVNKTVADSFTLALWIKAPSIGGDEAYFVEQGNGTASDWSLGMSNGLLRLKLGGQVLTSASPHIDNDQWHFVTATRDQATGQVALYVDGVSVATATFTTNRLTGSPIQYIGGDFFNVRPFGGLIDHLQLFGIDFAADAVQALYNRTGQAYCVAGGVEGTGARDNIHWTRLQLNQQDTRGGRITASGALRLQIDADKPVASITSVSNNEVVDAGQVIGGSASDPSSGVSMVEVSINNGEWQPAFGANTWSFSLAGLSDDVELRVRATDKVGNVGDPSAALLVHIDTTAPMVAIDPTPNTIKPTKNAANIWQVTLNGSVNDNLVNNLNASSLLVQLEQQSGVGVAQTQQPATVSGNRWTINYLLDANLFDPTGAYSVTAQVEDSVGLRSNSATGVVRLDAAGPVAHLSATDANRTVITPTLTINGVISDVNSIAGIDKLEIAFTPIEQVVALPPDITSVEAEALLNRSWSPVNLAQHGAGVANTTWSVAIPTDLENSYQIDLRGTDLLGNVAISGNVWRGVIDTRNPRVVMTATATGASYFNAASNQQMNEIRFLCAAQDRNLDERSFVCPGEGLAEPVRSFDIYPSLQTLFPDLTLRTGLAISYTLWTTTTTPAATARTCDSYGRCAQASTGSVGAAGGVAGAAVAEASVTAAAAPGAPTAVIINPTSGSFVAAGNALSVTVAAEAGAGLKDVTIKLDNTVVQTLNFVQSPAITRTLRTVNVPMAGEGPHTLVAQATAWDNSSQTTLFPVVFTLDQNAPTLTIDASALTLADTWVAGSGILRFNGNASDSVGLAAVQIREGSNAFVDATFGNGTWRVAIPVADPEGRALNITVRAIDRASRVTQLTQAIATDLSAADAPDTSISSGPANPSPVNTAPFVFAGSASAVTFECQLDNGVYTPCASPQVYSDLSKGSHTFRVRAIDSRGLPDLSPAEYTWTVNAGQPDATITGKPANPTTERTANFTFSGDATAARFECSLDGSVYAACTSPQGYSNLGNGEHTFLVRARNSANQASAADHYTWTVTNLVPVANNQTVVVIPNQAKRFTLTATDNEPLVYTIVTPPAHGVLAGLAPNLSYSPDTNYGGVDSFTFKVSDGLAESNLATVTLFVDNVPPVVTCSVTPNTLWPPNHKLISIQATVNVTDLHSGPAGFTLVSVTSSEPDGGTENGDAPNDIQNWVAGTPDVVGQLRAERAGGGNGRLYTLTYEGKDVANNKTRCTTTVSVPKNQGGVAAAAYDENQQFEDAFTDPLPAPADTVAPAPAPDNSNVENPDAGDTTSAEQSLHFFLPLILTSSTGESH